MITLQNVTKTFGSFKALDQLSLHVPKGAVYGLVGPNGAGKSTAIRHITGVYRPDSGKIAIDGEPVWENPGVKGRIGYIPWGHKESDTTERLVTFNGLISKSSPVLRRWG